MSFDSKQLWLFACIFGASVTLMATIWFFVLRTEYVPIYQNIRESDASLIVEELDNASITYRLANDGHDILVPKGQESQARVTVAGADIPMGGTTGFELFNESDLGLTEFAQKINLQRAIQGELARTIMMMQGVEFARVHLAIPERSLFRAEQKAPTAAVTVEMHRSYALGSNRIGGIRQLVASSVPGLTIDNVAVLNDAGDLVSADLLAPTNETTELTTERSAIEQLLTIRGKAAIASVLPTQPFDLQISASDRIEAAATEGEEAEQLQDAAQARLGWLTDKALRVLVRTPQELGPEERAAIRNALQSDLELTPEDGDTLDFSTGALTTRFPAVSVAPPSSSVAPFASPPAPQPTRPTSRAEEWVPSGSWSTWLLTLLAISAVALVALMAMRTRPRLSRVETESFAELLRSASPDLEPK